MRLGRASKPKNEAKNKKLIEKAKSVNKKEWELKDISIDSIIENSEQARSYYDPKKLSDLKRSIGKEGVLNPPVLYRLQTNDGICYQVKSGHRRIRAVKELGWTKLLCKIIPEENVMEATLSAVSTNHFVDNIHPVDKGVEVNSILIKMPGSEKERIDTIAEYLGVQPKTIKEWHSYNEIVPELRSLLVESDVRTKSKLRQAIKFSRDLVERGISGDAKNSYVEKFFKDINEGKKIEDKPSKTRSSSHYVYLDPIEGQFRMRKSWAKLSKKEQKKLARFLIECANEIDPSSIEEL